MDDLDPDRVAFPLGTHSHGDHMLTRRAALRAVAVRLPLEAYFYADLPYFLREGVDDDPVGTAAMMSADPIESPNIPDGVIGQKRAAMAHYHSQVELLAYNFGRHFAEVFEPGIEQLYRLRAA
jgi:LmbE family N-acetylglucosaminyl deacetylase